jgi:hypothetical protein
MVLVLRLKLAGTFFLLSIRTDTLSGKKLDIISYAFFKFLFSKALPIAFISFLLPVITLGVPEKPSNSFSASQTILGSSFLTTFFRFLFPKWLISFFHFFIPP